MADQDGIYIGQSHKPGAHPAQARQPARSDRRRHRHGQDRDPANHGRGLFGRRRAGLPGRRQRRSLRHVPAGPDGRLPGRARRPDRPQRLRAGQLPGRLLGRLRQAGPSDPHHDQRDGPPAPRQPARPERDPDRRPQHRLPDRRRRRPAAARPQGPALAAHLPRRQFERGLDPLRQRQQGLDRRHPARPAPPPAAGRAQVLRRAGPRPRRLHAHGRGRPRHHQRAGGRQADAVAAALCELPALASVGALRNPSGGRRSRQAEAGLFLRRGAPAVQEGAAGAARQDRSGRPLDPLQGCRCLLRHSIAFGPATHRASVSSAIACSTPCAPTRRVSARP